ncbi:MAG: VWA domain-containing protein [Verrucomicrobiae bacterium]|nr:VWA domain-containing protein [Verrucomicrobiae bacterium]
MMRIWGAALPGLEGFEFQHPWVLLLLLLLPPLAWWCGARGPLPTVPVPSLQGVRHLGTVPRRHRGALRWFGLLLPVALCIVALARPRLPRGDLPDPSRGIDILLTLDFSRSMAETDFRLRNRRVSRHEALVSVTGDFIKGRPNDRIGIVCFARTPWLVSPLTLDHEWAMSSLKEAELATGTGIGWAIAASTTFLKHDSDRNKVIILITDGDNSAGPKPFDMAPLAVKENIRVYTILIGPEMVTPSMAANHELNKVARLTGGQFFQAQDANALENIFAAIEKLEKRDLVQKRFVSWRELYPWFLWTAAAVWLVQLAADEVVRRRIP